MEGSSRAGLDLVKMTSELSLERLFLDGGNVRVNITPFLASVLCHWSPEKGSSGE